MTNTSDHQNSEQQQNYRGYGPRGWGRGQGGGPNMNWATSPGFHPGKLAAVVVGTAIFPPLGLAALAYFLWNSRGHYNQMQGGPSYAGGGRCGHRGMHRHGGFGMMRPSGNAAMDEHSAKVLNELAETRRAFWEYRAAEKAKRDADAFAKFQADAKAKSETPKPSDDAAS